MSKTLKPSDEVREEYDFSGGIRGKYAARFEAGSNIIVLDPDLASEFESSEEVNRALRVYLARKKSEEGAA